MEALWAALGGLGVGSLLSQIAQHILHRRSRIEERRLEEMKEAFTNLLTALAKGMQQKGSMDHQIEFALWEARAQLVAAPETVECIAKLKCTEPGTQERGSAMESMLRAMRKDLGIAK